MMLLKDMQERKSCGKRGGTVRGDRFRYMIEGESVSLEDIASRSGCCKKRASKRLRREKDKAGPVTWAGLAE